MSRPLRRGVGRASLGRAALWACLALSLSSASGCSDLYVLPDPPPKDRWSTVSLDPAEDERNAEGRYLAARTSILQLYDALYDEDWERAWGLLSSETQAFLDNASSEKDGKKALALGVLTIQGRDEEFDPVDLFIINDLRQLDDTSPGATEAETPTRKEIFATAADGTVHKIVVIREADVWRIHRTSPDR